MTKTSPKTNLHGLTDAEVQSRVKNHATNAVPFKPSRTLRQIISENLFNMFNNVLFALCLILILLGHMTDALVSAGVVVLNVLIAVIQEINAKNKLEAIAILNRPQATVIRDGVEQTLSPDLIVIDDLIVAEVGAQIVVDGMVVGREVAEIDESAITGEADPVTKTHGDNVYSGTFCVSGKVIYQAQKIGTQSLAYKLTSSARTFTRNLTELQKEINLIVRIIVMVAFYFAILFFFSSITNQIAFADIIKRAVVIVTLVPNGLFLSISLAYALGAIRIVGKGILVQQANAIESISHLDILCLDKTGTLTTNAIRFDRLLVPGGDQATIEKQLGDFVYNTSSVNPTSKAIAAACPGELRQVTGEVLFGSAHKWSALQFRHAPDTTYFLGAPEVLLNNLFDREAWREQEEILANDGLRVVLFAASSDQSFNPKKTQLPQQLKPLALIGLRDELRHDVQATLAQFQQAGVALKVISGDNAGAVKRIAHKAGFPAGITQISGPELERMTPSLFAATVKSTTIFGRITPEQKKQIVAALQSQGNWVGMLGDGVNDVLALKQADLAIAIKNGAEAARSVSDIILLENSFAALPFAVREGQRINNGMQDILKINLVRTFFVALIILSTGIIAGFPFTPKQLSLLGLLMGGIPSAAFALWARPGRVERRSMLRRLVHFVLPAALTMTLTALGVYLLYLTASTNALFTSIPYPLLRPNAHAVATAQTACTVLITFCGLFLIPFLAPPNQNWVGAEKLSPDRKPAYLTLVVMAMFIYILLTPALLDLFDLTDLGAINFGFIFIIALGWVALIKKVWTHKWFEHFFDVELRSPEI